MLLIYVKQVIYFITHMFLTNIQFSHKKKRTYIDTCDILLKTHVVCSFDLKI